MSKAPPKTSDASPDVAAMLRRISDKLAALNFPYFFEESETAAAALCSAEGTAWWMLRDAVVFAEEAVIGAGKLRAELRAKTRDSFVAALTGYASALVGLTDASGTPVFSAGSRIAVRSALANAAKDVLSQLVLVNFVVECAVAVEIRFSCGAEEVNISHQQWLRDQPRTLVTAIDSKQPAAAAAALSSGDAEADAASLKELLKAVFEHRGMPYPESDGAALADLLRLLQSLPVNDTGKGLYDPSAAIATLLAAVPSPFGSNSAKVIAADKHAKALEEAARVLRLLYTLDLKALQDDVNVQIGELQNLTATCKTDPRLGRVGR